MNFENLLSLIHHSATTYPHQPALYNPEETGYTMWTYEMLWQDICRYGRQLYALPSLESPARVGLLCDTRALWTICDLAILSTGLVTVPIYPTLPSNQILYIIQHSGMKALIVEDERQLSKICQLEKTDMPELESVVVLCDEVSQTLLERAQEKFAVHRISDFLALQTHITPSAWEMGWRSLTHEQLATIVYTSGTTGVPKGVRLTHGNLLANVEGILSYIRLVPTDRSISYLPLSHIFERTAGQFVPLASGASIVYSRGISRIVDDFREMPPTIFTTVPRLLEKIYEQVMAKVERGGKLEKRLFERSLMVGMHARVEASQHAGLRLRFYDKLVHQKIRAVTGGRLRMVVVGGAPMPPHVGRFFQAMGIPIVEGYGMTETSPVIAVNLVEHPRIGTAGKVLPNVHVKIAADGEILVQGPSVTEGYFHNDEATSQLFTEDGWLHTGDIGELRQDGYLHVTDRKKNLLVLSTGKKVTPWPIEAEIMKSPYIDQVLLVGQGRKYVAVLLVPRTDSVRKWFIEKGLSQVGEEDWPSHPELERLLTEEVRKYTASFAGFEQPKRILVCKPFTVENGQLTPTLKVRPKNVLEAYHTQIDRLYFEA